MDAHENEYAAAVNGMAEVYGSPRELPSVGDFVNGITAGRRWSGYVVAVEPGRLEVDAGGVQLTVHPHDVTRA